MRTVLLYSRFGNGVMIFVDDAGEEIASELSAGVAEEQSQCRECAREYASACPKFWGKISSGFFSAHEY